MISKTNIITIKNSNPNNLKIKTTATKAVKESRYFFEKGDENK
jgi:hypothetical protein